MIDLLLTIVCTTSIGVIVKLAETRIQERLTMLLFNYIIATLISAVLFKLSIADSELLSIGRNFTLSTFSLLLAPIAGFIFALNFFLMIIAIKKRGVALPVSLMRLSAIVPVAASLIFFGESPRWLQVIGMVGALIAAVMMSVSFKGGEEMKGEGRDSKFMLALWSVGLLICFGLADLSMKLFERFGDTLDKPLFLAVLFACAGLSVLIVMIAKRCRLRWVDALWGVILGVPNYFSSWFLVGSLTELPSYIVFPTVTAATVMLIALIGKVFFKEEFGKLGLIGIVLTMVSIVLVNV